MGEKGKIRVIVANQRFTLNFILLITFISDYTFPAVADKVQSIVFRINALSKSLGEHFECFAHQVLLVVFDHYLSRSRFKKPQPGYFFDAPLHQYSLEPIHQNLTRCRNKMGHGQIGDFVIRRTEGKNNKSGVPSLPTWTVHADTWTYTHTHTSYTVTLTTKTIQQYFQ